MFASDSTVINDRYGLPTLPGPLAAPAGWRSQVIHSDWDSLGTNDAIVNRSTGYHLANQRIRSRSADNFIGYNHGSINNEFHRTQMPSLTQQQQRNIVRTVETQYPPPVLVRKTLPNNQVTYQQNISVRYLQPPTPPPPGPLIIREVRPPPPPPEPPIKIRERPDPPPTPPPVVLRERPPPPPPHTPAKVVERLLPQSAPAPRQVIVERYGAHPPKPPNVVVERWLPYKEPGPRKVLVERAPEIELPPREPNLLVLYDAPNARVDRRYIHEGVICADPDAYLRRYGAEIDTWHSRHPYARLVDEATHAAPPPRSLTPDRYYRTASPYISETWERPRIVSPIPRSSSYHYGYSYYDSPDYYRNRSSTRYLYDSPYYHCNQSSSGYYYDRPSYYCNRSYSRYYDDDDYYRSLYYDSYRTRTPSWDRYYRSSSYDPYYSSSSSSFYDGYHGSSSYYPSNTIHVGSDYEFHRVLSDLTDGRVPHTVGRY